jgi:hypothetical protein
LPGDLLFNFERMIARRADELSLRRGDSPQFAVMNWLEAEWEICRDYGWSLDAPASASPSGGPLLEEVFVDLR